MHAPRVVFFRQLVSGFDIIRRHAFVRGFAVLGQQIGLRLHDTAQHNHTHQRESHIHPRHVARKVRPHLGEAFSTAFKERDRMFIK